MTDKKEKSPAFQFYPKDFMTDEKVLCMTPEERGYYIWLLCIDWLNNGFDKDRIATLAGIDPYTDRDENGKIIAQLSACFMAHPTKKGFVTNQRLQKEREKQEKFHSERSKSGEKGAKSRWGNKLKKDSSANGSAIKEPMAKNGSSSSTSSSNIYKKPTLKEVESYFREKNIPLSANAFFNHYEATDWHRGKTKIKNWKACVRIWLENDKKYRGNSNVVDKQETRTFTTISDLEKSRSERHPEEGQIRFGARQSKG